MLKRLRGLEENFSISKAAFIVGIFTLLTKFLAIYRERVFASQFGQDATLDSYFSAFRIPDFISGLLILSTLSVAFLPVFTELRTKDKEKAEILASSVLNIVGIGITIICAIVFLFLPELTKWLVPNFGPEEYQNTLNLSRLFLVSPLIFGLGTIFGALLNGQKKFLIVSLAPAFYNLGIIFGSVFLYKEFGLMGLGYGVILGALCQVTIQLVTLLLTGFKWRFVISNTDGYLKKVIKLYIPRIFSIDLSNIMLIMGSVVGSGLGSGSISALNQAFNLQSVPVSVIAFAFATALFPLLSEHYAMKDEKKFLEALSDTIKHTLFLMIPLSVLTMVFRAQVVRLILGTGKFTWEDTIATFTVLGIFAFSYFSQSLTTLLSRAFYARHNTKTPVLINFSSIFINIVLSFYFGKYTDLGLTGLALSFVIASVANATGLFFALRKNISDHTSHLAISEFDTDMIKSVTKVIACSILAGFVGYFSLYAIEPIVDTRRVAGLLIQCAISGGAAFMVYMSLAVFAGIPEAKRLLIPLGLSKLFKNR